MQRITRVLLCAVLVVGALSSLQAVQAETVCLPPLRLPVIGVPSVCVDVPPGGPGGPGGPGPDPCAVEGDPYPGQGHGGGDPKCLPGPASCVAIGVAVDTAPVLIVAPAGVHSELSRSTAQAQSGAYNGYAQGQSDSDAAQVSQSIPPWLGVGVVESECHAFSQTYASDRFIFTTNHADGRADVTRFKVDLTPYGIPLTVEGDVLCEHGSSTNAAPDPPPPSTCTAPPGTPGPTAPGMGNRADIANLVINGSAIVAAAAPPNTAIPLPPVLAPGLVGTIYLNEQGVSGAMGCPTYWGDALRIVVSSVLTGPVATVTISHVATTTC